MYDWSKFDIYFFLSAPPKTVFDSWATPRGLESFFVKRCTASAEGKDRRADESFLENDYYNWDWFFDYSSSGRILNIHDGKSLSFTFGKCVVTVEFRPHDDGTLLHLCQSGMSPTEEDKTRIHLDCRGGWIYFLTNLKALLEHQVDVRDKRPDTSRSLAINFVPMT
jgi:uncharacterized protein YndB with AHSA1/START domain